jgi:hypothetical protein
MQACALGRWPTCKRLVRVLGAEEAHKHLPRARFRVKAVCWHV